MQRCFVELNHTARCLSQYKNDTMQNKNYSVDCKLTKTNFLSHCTTRGKWVSRMIIRLRTKEEADVREREVAMRRACQGVHTEWGRCAVEQRRVFLKYAWIYVSWHKRDFIHLKLHIVVLYAYLRFVLVYALMSTS